MPTSQTLLAFTLVSLGIVLLPGPSNLFLLAHGIRHGRRAAVAAMTGVSLASAIRVLLTAAGLSAVLASSAVTFDIIRWGGVIYLAYLGVRAFRSSAASGPVVPPAAGATLGRSVRKGLIVGLGNPKMMIFFVAFFPQFVDAARGSAAEQMLLLGAVFWTMGVLWDLLFACMSGTIGNWLEKRPRMEAAQPRIEGIAYLGLATWAAI